MRATILVLVTAACGSTTGPHTPDAEIITIESIASTPATVAAKRGLDKPTQLTVTAMLSNSTTRDITNQARYASSNASVATVSTSGLVTPVGPGNAMIMMDYENNSTQAMVTVTSPQLFVTETVGTIGVDVFDAYQSGNIAPAHQITGALTTFQFPWGVQVYKDEIYVADGNANAIDVFPVTATGNVAPTRRITGALTTLNQSYALVIANDEIYVGSVNEVVVFPTSATGNVAPARTITGAATTVGTVFGLAIYKNELYVSQSPPQILVFPQTANGNVAPTRTIAGAATQLGSIYDVRVVDDEIFVTNLFGVRVFLSSANGNVAPIRNLFGPNTPISTAPGLLVLGNELYLANVSAPIGTQVFPKEATGDAPVIRGITGALTTMQSPRSLDAY